MRGTPSHMLVDGYIIGIIPAYAGNTVRICVSNASRRDHPRVCGEHPALFEAGVSPLGSSPRMRGTRPSCDSLRKAHGIIPAYAGNTCRSAGSLPWPWDHPRVCGEHLSLSILERSCQGSSPRMRGTLDRDGHIGSVHGIIPAYAGNTLS